MSLTGTYCVHRYANEEHELPAGTPLGTMEAENAIQTAGRDHLLDLMVGQGGGNHADNANSQLEVEDSNGDPVSSTFPISSTDAGFPDHPSQLQARWQWSDETADEYTVDTVRLRILGENVVFSERSDPFQDNQKPSTENWTYEYTITISGDTADVQDAGLEAILQIFTGEEDDEFDQNGTRLEVFDSGVSLGGQTPDSEPSRSGATTTWEWTVDEGDLTGSWDTVEVQSNAWTDSGVVLSSGSGPGQKDSNTTREYTYTFTLNL